MSPEESSQERQESDNRKSHFQHLWAEAESLAHDNTVLEQALDALVNRVHNEIFTAEQAMGETIREVVYRQIEFSRRKSLLKWQRAELNEWIGENLEELDAMGLMDEPLADEMERIRADQLDITEEDGLPGAQHMSRVLSADIDDLVELDDNDDIRQVNRKNRGSPDNHPPMSSVVPVSDDFFDDDPEFSDGEAGVVIEAGDVIQDAIDEDMAELFEEFFEEFEADQDSRQAPENEVDIPEAVNPEVFKRLFRQTAAALHPDKEADEQRRAEKQILMARLLKARNENDLITLISLHKQHSSADTGLGSDDERALEGLLLNYLEQQESRRLEIIRQSPMHEMVYERFYNENPTAVTKKINEHLDQIRERHESFLEFINQITNLKSLKKLLEIRYDSLAPRDLW